ncbi:zinc finger CCCH domain-containing protein 3 [Leptopilina heterotoma]|uniref:zinc finger CCCH domain-containing protein 3 n=1 Tax=Leptopilina heterotoma TaxID=63436 RepID=UPI001CA8CB8D|nr:zinc finger CCCH domain-containing protein 3 [Leptopilina heterotoma]XP_043469155.1 zinc finger CCCH domain-containing protein 3 [Leptopilina heterotoma]
MTGELSFHKCDTNTLNSENKLLANNLEIPTKNVRVPESSRGQTEIPNKIYVNPNYAVKKHLIHVNPNVHKKTSIHINPKVDNPKTSIYINPKLNSKPPVTLKLEPKTIPLNPKPTIAINPKIIPKSSIYVNPKPTTTTTSVNSKAEAKIYVNPKIVRDMNIVKNLQENNENSAKKLEPSTSTQDYLKKSVHVNPKLMKTITNSQSTKSLPTTIETKSINQSTNYNNIYSKSNVTSTGTNNNKFINPNYSIVSRRKLIRVVKRNIVKTNSLTVSPIKARQFGNKVLKRVSGNILSPSTSPSVQINNRLKFVKSKTKVSAYKLDRIAVSKGKNKTNSSSAGVKSTSNFKKLVSIEGIRYNSSKNQLIRRNSTSPTKKKRTVSSKSKDQFFIASNGKALRRIDTTTKNTPANNSARFSSAFNRNSIIKRTSFVSLKQTIKSNMSNKVKQRSIQLLRNKMRKNNQPCLFFRKFGYCANQAKGTCHKVHDKKQIALCKNFLQGKCLVENCKLSHDVGPEKMPTCKYFLEGCCSRDKCPYLHVKVSEKTPICREFLQGYCAKGTECKERHIFACPEFEKEGKCSKGKQCPYPHKSKTKNTPRTLNNVNKELTNLNASNENDLTCTIIESRKRYYDSSNDDLEEKRERLLRKLKIVKAAQNQNEESTIIINEDKNEETEVRVEIDTTVYVPRKRPPVGNLPSYIPIN